VNALLDDVNTRFDNGEGDDEEWGGIEEEEAQIEPVDHEEEYIDEDKYTTVTVEAVDISKEGIKKSGEDEHGDEEDGITEVQGKVSKEDKDEKVKKVWPKKPKKKFRYESKTERKLTRIKQRSGGKSRAGARRGND
jgi:ribosomal RNA-processing protein 17